MAFRLPPLPFIIVINTSFIRFQKRFDALSGAYRILLHLIYTMYISRDYQYMFLASLFPSAKLLLFFSCLQSPFWSFLRGYSVNEVIGDPYSSYTHTKNVRLVSFNLGAWGSRLPNLSKYLPNKAHVVTWAESLVLGEINETVEISSTQVLSCSALSWCSLAPICYPNFIVFGNRRLRYILHSRG